MGLDYARTVPDYSVTGGIFKTRDFTSPQSFSEAAWPHGGRLLCDSTWPAPYVASPVLAKSLCPIPSLVPGPVLHQGKAGRTLDDFNADFKPNLHP